LLDTARLLYFSGVEAMYYIADSDGQKGPFDWNQIQSLAVTGKVSKQAFYWKPGMESWVPLTTLHVFTPPAPRVAKPVKAFQNEYDAPLYRVAYYQQRVSLCLVIVLLLTGVTYFCDPKGTTFFLCSMLLTPFAFYWIYCYLRYQSSLYGWGWGSFMVIVSLLIPPLIIFRLVMSAHKFRVECEEHGLKVDWLGTLSPNTKI
jgi:hypothetical protein